MSSSLGDIQPEQIRQYREAWEPRVSVFPIVDDETCRLFSLQGIGSLGEGRQVTFGRTCAAEPDVLVEKLQEDPAVMETDTMGVSGVR